jgi:anti-anti-sigma regulatory factor
MPIDIESRESWLKIRVSGRTDCFNFEETKANLSEAAHSGKPVALDVSGAEFLNMKMIKFVHGLALEMREKGHAVALVGASEKLKKQFRVFASLDPMLTFTPSEWEVEQAHTKSGNA